jgi:Ser-tRNA(Ala) deacylase AlaX
MTTLAYFEDATRTTLETLVTECASLGADDDRYAVVTESTIAYPAGGGQPSDRGVMTSTSTSTRFEIESSKNEGGTVRHVGRFEGCERMFEKGERVTMTIDGALRKLHARIHSAGHALDVAMIRIGLGPEMLMPTKGQHFPSGAYVEYDGKLDPGHDLADKDALMHRLNAEMSKLIEENGASRAAEMSYDEAKASCGGSLPPYISQDMRPRVVVIVPDTPGCPCGGTHVANVGEIEKFKLTGVRVKKGVTRLSYAIPGMDTWEE